MSAWIQFVREFARMNNLTYAEALKAAGPYYRQQMEGAGYSVGEQRPRARRRLQRRGRGVVIGAAEQGALAALLKGLNARITVD